jgi:hypothetical protein
MERTGGNEEDRREPCATCGNPSTVTVMLILAAGMLEKDLCEAHLAELLENSRPAQRELPHGFRPPELA